MIEQPEKFVETKDSEYYFDVNQRKEENSSAFITPRAVNEPVRYNSLDTDPIESETDDQPNQNLINRGCCIYTRIISIVCFIISFTFCSLAVYYIILIAGLDKN